MLLLKPSQNKDRQSEELARKVIRIQEIEDLASKANAKLAQAESDFQSILARNRAKWAIEEEEHAERVKSMLLEINALENRKKQALIPISLYKKEADKIMLEAQELLQKVKEKEENIDFLQEKLEEKLTSVGDRELSIEREEKLQLVAREGIEIQKEQVKSSIKHLSEEMIMFHEKQQEEETNLTERKKEVYLIEVSLKAQQDKLVQERETMREKVARAERQLAKLKGFEKFEL